MMKAKRLLMNINRFLTRPTMVVIVILLLIGFALGRQNGVIQRTKDIATNTNHLVERQRESLCLLVVHAEESDNVTITEEIRDYCGDIFRTLPEVMHED